MTDRRRLKLEDKRKSLVGPLNGVVNDINALFKAPRDRIDEIVAESKRKMNKYVQAQQAIAEAKRRAEEEQARKDREEAARLAEELKKMSGDAGAETAQVLTDQADLKLEQAKAPAKVAPTRGDQANVITTKKWKAQPEDIVAICTAIANGKLPAHFVEPNMRALQDYARELKEEQLVHGIRIYQDISTVVR